MARFHVNSKTGKPGRCAAQHACPFGDLQTDHYDDETSARQAYEKTMQAKTFSPLRKRRVMTAVAVTLVASFSLSGCKTPDISIPQIETPSVSQETPTSSPGTSSSSVNVQETLAKLNQLEVKGRAPMTGYDRDAFITGSKWDKARQSTLKRDLTDITYKGDGNILSGTLVQDPYTGKSITYVRGGKSEIDVDHVVSLGNAWSSGIQYKDAGTRLALATDPDNLLAVDAGANRQKGDGDAATWLPANKSYRCTYVVKQTTIKFRYKLSVTAAEKTAITNVLQKDC